MKNYYAILEVSRSATRDEIKQAYIDHICFIHPDRFEKDTPDWENATSLLIDINEAYACLGDPEKRADYDALMEREEAGGEAGEIRPKSLKRHLSVGFAVAFLIVVVSFHLLHKGNPADDEAYAGAATGNATASAILSDDVESVDDAEDGVRPDDPAAVKPTPSEGAILAAISKERPSNKATSTNTYGYVQLTNDEYYEILLEVDSTVIYDGGRIAAVWTKHIQNEEQKSPAALKRLDSADAGTGNIGWFVTLNVLNLEKDTTTTLKIMYYDKNGVFIGGSDVPDRRVRWTAIRPGTPANTTLGWIKDAVKATEKVTEQHQRAVQIGRYIVSARDRTLQAEYSNTNKKIKNFNVKRGGTITARSAFCRTIPTQDAPIKRGKLVKDTPVFVTKQYRDENGKLWYYVEHIKTKGWVVARSLKVY